MGGCHPSAQIERGALGDEDIETVASAASPAPTAKPLDDTGFVEAGLVGETSEITIQRVRRAHRARKTRPRPQSPASCFVPSTGLRIARTRRYPRAGPAVCARFKPRTRRILRSRDMEVVLPSADNAAPRRRVLFLGPWVKTESVEQFGTSWTASLPARVQEEGVLLDPPPDDLDEAAFWLGSVLCRGARKTDNNSIASKVWVDSFGCSPVFSAGAQAL